MTIRKAVNHFIWKFNNVWKASEEDIKALKTIMSFVEDKHKKQINDYHLFARLYIMVYAQYLERYKATVFDDIPKKELGKYLDQPLEYIIQRFTDKLNESEMYELLESCGVEEKHPATKSQNQKSKEVNALHEALKDDNNLDKFLGKVWDYDTVKENLELQINNSINLYKKNKAH